jgi:hypothetical protein
MDPNTLQETLSSLISPQFNQVLFVFGVEMPEDEQPSIYLPQRERAKAVIEWAMQNNKLSELEYCLDRVLGNRWR